MANFVPGYATEVYVGEYDWTTFMNSAEVNAEQDLVDASTFRSKGKRKAPTLDDGTFDLEGIWNWSQDGGTTDGPEEYFTGIFKNRTRVPVTVAYDGGSVGDNCKSASIRTASYKVTVDTEDIIRFTLSLEADRGVDFGKVVHALGTVSADTTGAAVDLGIAPGKGRAYLHCFALSGSTTLDVTIEHSDDGSTGWATAGTFTQLAAEGAQSIDIATLKRYVRAKLDFTGGSPSGNLVVSVHPRLKA